MTLSEIQAKLVEMQADAEAINDALKPLCKRDPARRDEPMWNAHSVSAGIVSCIRQTRSYLTAAIREEQ